MTPSAVVEDHTAYGNNAVKEILSNGVTKPVEETSNTEDHHIVLKTFRLLIADLCQQFNGGHPGGAIGMAAIGVALWKYVMRYAPHTPGFFNRDRFVLSNGYKAMTFDQLKSYHSAREDALCPGHPEIEHEGIEVTTGPLGQGVANAVGLAMATKNLAATYNRDGYNVVSNHTWCMVGDACLQEGVGLEAISLAGHWKLDNLTIIYDNNQVTCDGSVDLTNTEDINAKMTACGFEVIDVMDGCYDIEELVSVLARSRSPGRSKPTFINVRTIIGLGSAVAGDAIAHGAAFGKGDVAKMKKAYGFNPEEHFVIGDKVRRFFEGLPARGEKLVSEWNDLVSAYSKANPELASGFKMRVEGRLPENWEDLIPKTFPTTSTPSRKSNGLVFNPIAAKIPTFMVGTADLSPSVNMIYPNKVDFQHPALKTTCGITGNYSGRYIHYGVREHVMAAVSNGLAAFNPGTFIPTTSSFFMFYLYAAPAVRMGALQHLQVIHAATHDSIGMGEDGPTHQPIELATLYRAMPNLFYIRPADSEEAAGAWKVAIKAKSTPSIISTSRHSLPQTGLTNRDGVAKGAYVIREAPEGEKADITLLGVGAEFCIVADVADVLTKKGLNVRLVSFPSWKLFETQDRAYRRSILRRNEGIPAVVVEPYSSTGWERYADAALCMKSFGKSLPGKLAYEYFGFGKDSIVEKIEKYMESLKKEENVMGEFVEL
ncbi:MAG: hypothetical protein M1834_000660 [Cirrosporium novae-zelandiae]|nr:MAG: hypothetical protein M1834_000660 [Cirrosporium novae-zelandiae]